MTAHAIGRLFGLCWFERRRKGWEARFNWGEVTGTWGLAFGLSSFEEGFSLHVHLGYPNAYISLPFLRRWHREPEDITDSWGFTVDTDSWSSVHLNWGARTKIVHLPWAWEHERTSFLIEGVQMVGHLVADGIWLNQRRFDHHRRWQEKHPYRHVLSTESERGEPAGTAQEVIATISVVEREWRRRWLRWTRLGAKVVRAIEVDFSDEVGNRAGSWKGGTVGCSYAMLPGEEPIDTLRRMERERSFDR